MILVSADRTTALDRVAGLMLGADDYLAKPVDPGELLARVAARFDGRGGSRDGNGNGNGKSDRTTST